MKLKSNIIITEVIIIIVLVVLLLLTKMDNDNFYVHLPSNVLPTSPTEVGNTIGNYVTRLAQKLNLSEEWEVALTDISYTKSWYNVIKSQSISITFQTEEYILDEELPAGNYETPELICNAINKIVENGIKKLTINEKIKLYPQLIYNKESNFVNMKCGYIEGDTQLSNYIWLRFSPFLAGMLGLLDRNGKQHPFSDEFTHEYGVVRNVIYKSEDKRFNSGSFALEQDYRVDLIEGAVNSFSKDIFGLEIKKPRLESPSENDEHNISENNTEQILTPDQTIHELIPAQPVQPSQSHIQDQSRATQEDTPDQQNNQERPENDSVQGGLPDQPSNQAKLEIGLTQGGAPDQQRPESGPTQGGAINQPRHQSGPNQGGAPNQPRHESGPTQGGALNQPRPESGPNQGGAQNQPRPESDPTQGGAPNQPIPESGPTQGGAPNQAKESDNLQNKKDDKKESKRRGGGKKRPRLPGAVDQSNAEDGLQRSKRDTNSSQELTNEYIVHPFREVDINGGIHALYVYCNIIKPVLVGNFEVPLIRRVEIPNNKKFGSQCEIKYQQPQYYPLVSHEINSIEIEIKDDSNQPIEFAFGRTAITLHFRKKPTNVFQSIYQLLR